MWRIRRRCSLVALPPKLSSTKTIWPVMQAQEIFEQSAELSFLHPNVSVNNFYFQVKYHEHFFKIAVAYTSFPRFHQRTKNVENNRLHTQGHPTRI